MRGSNKHGARVGYRVDQAHGSVRGITVVIIGPSPTNEGTGINWNGGSMAHGCASVVSVTIEPRGLLQLRFSPIIIPRQGGACHGGLEVSTDLVRPEQGSSWRCPAMEDARMRWQWYLGP